MWSVYKNSFTLNYYAYIKEENCSFSLFLVDRLKISSLKADKKENFGIKKKERKKEKKKRGSNGAHDKPS